MQIKNANKKAVRSFILFAFLLAASSAGAQFYNGYQMTFGKNRIQYEDRFWSFYKWKNVDTYFYLGGQELSIFAGRTAENELSGIEKLLDYNLDGRIQFIIYNKLSDAKQSNIGLETEENANNIGGVTRIVGNKVFLYFEGDHDKLHRQIRAGIAKVLIDQMMYGGDVKDRVQNAALLSLPEWYVGGLISYISHDWDVAMDNYLRDGVINKRYLKFNHLQGKDAMVAGHSVWKYIVDTYGESTISNLLYITRINRNLESGFLYVLGLNMKTFNQNWNEYISTRFAETSNTEELATGLPVIKRAKKNVMYSQPRINADGRYVAYVSNNSGKYRIFLSDMEKNKRKRVLRSGYRSFSADVDLSFPVLAWHPSGELLAYIRERKGKLWLGYYNVQERKKSETRLFNFEKVLDFSYAPDGQSLLLSAVQKGQSDIFLFNLRTRTYEQITNDFYDDLNPRFINNGKAIVFSSNRTNDTLGSEKRELLPEHNNFDIFYFDYRSKSPLLKRITNTELFNEFQPIPYDSLHFAYLSDENGIVNRHTAFLDSALASVDTVEHYRMIVSSVPQTNYGRNLVMHDINSRKTKIAELFYNKGKLSIYLKPVAPAKNESSSLIQTKFRSESIKSFISRSEAPPAILPQTKPAEQPAAITEPVDSNTVDIENYYFQSEFQKPKNKKEQKKKERSDDSAVTDTSSTDSRSSFTLPKQRNYDPNFSSSYFVAQLDNSLLNSTYQVFTGGGGVYFNPSLNGFFKIGITDLLDDYRIVGGFKLAGDLNSNEYFMSYENLKRRVDHKITFYRQGRFDSDGFSLDKIHTHELRYQAKYPFSDITSLRLSVAGRNDRVVYLSTDITNLKKDNVYFNWATGRLEFVFDNSLPLGINLYTGARSKIFGEYYRQIGESNTNMFILGLDYRHYTRIHHELIWANRFAASTSFGDQKLIYYLGSTDNWIIPRFNTETPIDFTQNYAYQALATNLRGFDQNIRNGNSFALFNSELRWPVFRYLLNRPIKSDFVRNFQVIGFGDIGTAWNGSSPYDSTNALNKRTISRGPFLNITLFSQHDPLVGGFGFGLRSRVLGYFLRGDWAWGVEDGEIKPYKFYFSLSLDF